MHSAKEGEKKVWSISSGKWWRWLFYFSVFKRKCFRCLAVAGWLSQWECNESLTDCKMFRLGQQWLTRRNNCPKASSGAEVSPFEPLSRRKAYIPMYCSYEKMFDGAQVDGACSKKIEKVPKKVPPCFNSLTCNKMTKWHGACTKIQPSKAYAEHMLKHMLYVGPTDLFLCLMLNISINTVSPRPHCLAL